MPASNIATAADYADAMMIARRAKNWLFLLLLVMLIAQIAVFFVARHTDFVIAPEPSLAETLAPATRSASTLPTTAPTTQASAAARNPIIPAALRYLTALIDFLGIALIVVLALVLLLITKIMLVGRLIGVAQVTSAFIWCILLAVLLFPWQAFLQNTDFSGDFKIPGVLYTWSELTHPTQGAKFGLASEMKLEAAGLRWARFVVWPAVSVVFLLIVQARSSRGLRAALGETELESTGEMVVS